MKKFLPNVLFLLCLIFTMSVELNADNHLENEENNECMDCITAPIIICPSTYFGCPQDNIDPINTGFPTAMPGDTNCPTPIVTYTDVFVTNTPCLKVIHRTWLAEYPPGSASIKLHSQCQQTLVLEDLEVPVIENCPSDITVDLANNCDSTAVWNIPTAVDDCGIQYFITTHFSGSTFPLGTTAVIYTAQDWCGQQETCTFDVTVEGSCCSSVSINCPQARTVCVGGDISPNNTGYATPITNDVICPIPLVTYIDSTLTSGPCPGAMLLLRTWTATDTIDSSITANCTQLISVSDVQSPTVTNIPTDIVVSGTGSSCTVPVTWNEPTAFDNCGIASFTSNYASGDAFVEGSTLVVYTATDNCGNSTQGAFLVNVNCQAASCSTIPNIICPNFYSSCPSTSNPDPAISGYAVAFPGDVDCNQPILMYTDVITSTGSCVGTKTIERTFTATDPDNNSLSNSCIQNITLSDSNLPSIIDIPSNIVVTGSGSGCSVPVSWTEPTAQDNCGISSLTASHLNGSYFNSGNTTVVYTATDNCGSTATESFTVTVECTSSCNSLPILTCPNNYVSCPSIIVPSPALSGFATSLPGGIDCNQPILSFIDNITSTGTCPGVQTINRTWIATDPDNTSLTVNCVQSITLEDSALPSITNMPSDITVTGTNTGCSMPVSWNLPTANDNCGIASFTSDYPLGSVFNEGTTTVTYTATDNCGSVSTATFNVTVNCINACNNVPTINCPTNYTNCPSINAPNPATSGYAIAFPGSIDCNQPILTFIDNINSTGSCSGVMNIERTWIATDPDNTSLNVSCIQTISLEDNEAPIISNVPVDFTVNGFGNSCLIPVTWNTPTFNDNCGIASSSSNYASGSFFPEGITTVIYTATDNCGQSSTASFDITVNCFSTCNSAPIINGPQNYWACPNGSIPGPDVAGWATAQPGSLDCADPILTYNDVIIYNGVCSGADVIERTWTATDPSNSSLFSTYVQSISLEDNNAPYFVYCPTDILVNANNGSCTAIGNWSAVTATDNCSLPDLDAVDQYGNTVVNGGTFNEGINMITFTATDLCGNTAECSFNVTVVCAPSCDTAPSINCPTDKVICPGSSSSASILGWAIAYAGTSCPTPVVNYQDIITSTGPCNGEKVINRTWTASYNSGSNLTSSCVQIITAKDIISPTFTGCPNDITVNNNSTSVTWAPPHATDFCSIPNVTSTHQPGTYFPLGTTSVIYTATDYCGNIEYCSFNVTVLNDNTATITCPEDIYLSCDSLGGAIADWSAPLYEGSCSNCNPNDTIAGFVYMGTFNGNQYYCSTSTATWPQAQQICHSNGGYLASINDAEENQFLADILTLQSAWIGLSDAAYEGDFAWDSGQQLDYTNWYANQPNNYNNNQDYVEMLNNGLWNDQYNHYALEFIMEVPCTFIQQIEGPEPGTFLTGGRYTVSYALNDACGANSTCSFDIFVDGGLSITCPDDISVSAASNSNGVIVDWKEPDAFTCCSSCNDAAGETIQGFVYMGAFGGHHYYCSTQPASWEDAKINCENNGGSLAVINDQFENTFLTNLLNTQSAWIGLSDTETEGDFEWVNGENLNFTNWYPGQPNNYNNSQDYVELLNTGQWNDQYNSYNLEYIMELPGCLNITQTEGPTSGTLLAPGTNHIVTYLATDGCGNSQSCSFEITVESIPVNTTYCNSASANSQNYYIDSVVLGTLNNPSGNDGGYGDYTYKCYGVDQNLSYDLQLDPGYAGQPDDKVYWKVWIDFNQDGDFEDADEYVAYGCGTSTLSGTIVMPPILTAGETRMRVIMQPGAYATGPCDNNYLNGETEDYCLTIWGTGNITSDDNIDARSNLSMAEPTLLKVDKSDIDIKVYPNPAVEIVNVELGDIDVVSEIKLFNSQGQLVSVLPKVEYKNKINVSTLNSGMYLIAITNNNGERVTRKIMIQK